MSLNFKNVPGSMKLNLEGGTIYRDRQRSFSDQSVQTCTYCSFHNGTLPCSICIHDGSHGSSNVMLRPIAIIAPFKEANLVVTIDDIAHRLRSISDDIDQQYGALPAHANANVGFFGMVWGSLQVMVAAFARLVGR